MSTFQVKDPDRIGVAFLGVGRMGLTHAATVAGIRNARVVVVGDPDLAAAERGRALLRADRATADVLDAIHDPAVEAVVVATPTNTHAGLIEAALRAGKAVWSEKPIALDLAETSRVVALWRETGLPVQLGFMRRFDPGYVRAKALIDAGEIGRIEQFRAYSRDTYPASIEFLRHSGGSFLDMSVHDFDLARFLVGEVDEVQAWGSVVFDERFAEVGDVDTAVTMLRFQNGALGVVEMSRHSEWGYDIRTEVAGALSKVVIEAHQKTSAIHSRRFGFEADHYENFPDRFEVAFRVELETFFRTLAEGGTPTPGTRGRPRDAPARDRRDQELAREPAGPRGGRHGRGLGVTGGVVRHVRPGAGPGTLLEITPASVGWRYLSFRVIRLGPGETIDADTADQEAAIVPLAGSGSFTFAGATHPVARRDVFTAKPHVAYLPPRTAYTIETRDGLEIAIGSAPAEGRYPARLVHARRAAELRPRRRQRRARGDRDVRPDVRVRAADRLRDPHPERQLVELPAASPRRSVRDELSRGDLLLPAHAGGRLRDPAAVHPRHGPRRRRSRRPTGTSSSSTRATTRWRWRRAPTPTTSTSWPATRSR